MSANMKKREKQWGRLAQHLQSKSGCEERRIIAGDLNTMRPEPLYRKMTKELVDAFAEAGEGPGATFPNLVSVPPFPMVRLDYVLLKGPLKPKEVKVLPDSGSDHLAVRAIVGF
jgi:endonuclease/exonuclease/phosphatase (EEP) superfamily protein YafD